MYLLWQEKKAHKIFNFCQLIQYRWVLLTYKINYYFQNCTFLSYHFVNLTIFDHVIDWLLSTSETLPRNAHRAFSITHLAIELQNSGLLNHTFDNIANTKWWTLVAILQEQVIIFPMSWLFEKWFLRWPPTGVFSSIFPFRILLSLSTFICPLSKIQLL